MAAALASSVIATQLPVDKWHAYIDPTIADAILDRLVHNAHQIKLAGGSLRRVKANFARPKSSGE